MELEFDHDQQPLTIWNEKSSQGEAGLFGSNVCSLKNHSNVMKELISSLEIHQPDVRIVCSGGAVVETHRLILAAASPNFLKPLLIDTEDSESASIVCPDISEECMNRVLRLLYYGETSLDEHFGQCLDVLASLQFPLHKMVVEVKTKSNVTSFIKAISGHGTSFNHMKRQTILKDTSEDIINKDQPNSQACQTFLIRRVDGGLNLSENLSSNSSFLSIVDKCSRTGELENDNCGTLTLKLRNNDDDKNHKQQNVYYDSSALTNFQMISSNKNDTLEGAENDPDLTSYESTSSTAILVQQQQTSSKLKNSFFCDFNQCYKSFNTQSELRIHSKLAHKVDITSKASDSTDSCERNIQCQTYKKSFRSIEGLKSYSSVHQSRQRFDASNRISPALNGIINCQQCDTIFNNWTCFTDHLQKVHGNAPKIVIRYKGPGTAVRNPDEVNSICEEDVFPTFNTPSQSDKVVMSSLSNIGGVESYDNNLLFTSPKIILGEISANQETALFTSNKKWIVQSGQHFNGKICLGLATIEPAGAESTLTANALSKKNADKTKLTENMINQKLSMLKPNLEVMKPDLSSCVIKRVVRTGDKVIECQICKTTLKSTKSYKRHMDQCHSSGRPKHVCILCQRTFKRSDNLTAHYRSVHCGLKPNNCACGKGYRTKNELLRHCRNSCPTIQSRLKMVCVSNNNSPLICQVTPRSLLNDQKLNIVECNSILFNSLQLVTSSNSSTNLYASPHQALSPPQVVCSSMPSPQALESCIRPVSSSLTSPQKISLASDPSPMSSQIVSSTISSPKIVDSSIDSPKVLTSPQIVESPESISSMDSNDEKPTDLADCIVDQEIDLSHGYFSDLDFDYDVTASNDLMQF